MRMSAAQRWQRAQRNKQSTIPRRLLASLGLVCEGLRSEITPTQLAALHERGLTTAKGCVSAKGHRALADGYGWTVVEVKDMDLSRVND